MLEVIVSAVVAQAAALLVVELVRIVRERVLVRDRVPASA